MKTAVALSLFTLTGSLFAAETMLPPLPPGSAPFAVNTTSRIRNTRFIPGKGVSYHQGKTVRTVWYKTGIVQFQFTESKERFGGLAIEADGKSLKGTRREENSTVFMDFPGQGTLRGELLADGRIALTLDFPKMKTLAFGIQLLGSFFGSSKLFLDGRAVALPASLENADGIRKLFEGDVTTIRPGGRDFSLTFSSPVHLVLENHRKSKFFYLRMTPAKQGKPVKIILDPGSEAAGSAPAPANRITKAAACDLWALDRYCAPDPAGKNLLQNSSFEQDFRYLMFRLRGRADFRLLEKKPVKISTKEALYGKKSLSIFSLPDGSMRQPVCMQTVILPAGTYTVSLYAKTTAPGKQTLLLQMMDPKNVWKQNAWPTTKAVLTGEWKRYTLTHTWKENVAIPVTLTATSTAPATCFIDGIQLEKGGHATEYVPPLVEGPLVTNFPENFAEYGKPLGACLDVISAPETPGKVAVKVKDFFGTVKFQGDFNFTTDKKGHAKVSLPLEDLPRGIFVVETDYEIAGQKRYEIQRFSIMSFLDNTHKHKNLFCNTYVDPFFPKQYYKEVLKRERNIGYGSRSGFTNTDEALAKLAKSYGVDSIVTDVSVHLKQNNDFIVNIRRNTEYYLYAGLNEKNSTLVYNVEKMEATPENLKRVEDAAAEIAALSPTITGWYFLREPEGTFPTWANPAYAKPDRLQNFFAFEAAVARGIRRGNPKAEVITSATSNFTKADRQQFYRELLKAAKKNGITYDAIASHCYRPKPEGNPSLEDEIKKLFAIFAEAGYDKIPLDCPEGMHWLPVRCRKTPFVSDYPIVCGTLNALCPYTYDMSYAEKIGSAFRARTWLVGLKMAPRIRSMCASNYDTFEMDAMLTPFAFQKIPNTLGRLLGNADFKEELSLFAGTCCYLFEDEEKRPVAVLWCHLNKVDDGEAAGPDFTFKPQGKLELFDLMEAEHSLPADKAGFCRIPVTQYPIFLRGEPGSLARMTAMLKAGKWHSNIPVVPALQMALPNEKNITASITNTGITPLTGTLECSYGIRDLALPPGKSASLLFPLPQTVSADAQNHFDIRFTLQKKEGKRETFEYDRSFDALAIKKALQPMPLDGDEGKWAAYPAIAMTRRMRGKAMSRKGLFPTPEDLSAEYRACWDEKGLHIAVRVKDNLFCAPKRAHVNRGWQNDSVQIFIDSFADGRNAAKRTVANDDWSYGVYMRNETGENCVVYRHAVPDVQLTQGVGGAEKETVAPEVKTAFKRLADGYFLEIAFPPESLMPGKLEAGSVLGVGMMVNDCDDPKSPEPSSRIMNTSDVNPKARPDTWPLFLLKK